MNEDQPAGSVDDILALLDWKRRIFALYEEVRRARDPADGWLLWIQTRRHLFRSHSQSPVPPVGRATFAGPDFFPYDPSYRVLGETEPAETLSYDVPTSTGGICRFTRFGLARFDLGGQPRTLELYWLEGYGGGLFLPFRDETSAVDTYGGGRYLLDTVKGADLGAEGRGLVLDFNFAYNPSCAYDPRWACPLAPAPNRLEVPVRAGERVPLVAAAVP